MLRVVLGSLALAAQVSAVPHPVIAADEGHALEERLATLETRVTALSLKGMDAPSALVKEHSGGMYDSCEHVAAQGLCGHELAQMGCAQSCSTTLATDAIKAQAVTAAGSNDNGPKRCYSSQGGWCKTGSCKDMKRGSTGTYVGWCK